MSKAPSFQMYPGDWRRDTQVQMASFSTRGIWIEMLLCMWGAPERGKLEGSVGQISRLLGCTEREFTDAMKELKDTGIADVSVTCNANVTNGNGCVTIINRRMFREEKIRIATKYRVQKFRATQKNEFVTPPVTQPTSSSSSCTKVHYTEGTLNVPVDLISKWAESYPALDIKNEISKMESWILANPKNSKSNWQRFMVNWLSRAQDKAPAKGGGKTWKQDIPFL
jgi:hypothetical protein